MSSILDKTILEQLKCTTCKNYISVGPVTRTSDGHNCGRCPVAANDKNALFEVLAKNCKFPCRYDINGCKVKLPFGEDVINHERECEYRLILCPVVDGCEWSGLLAKSFEHCWEKHKKNVAHFSKFEVLINLQASLDCKMVMKRKSGEVLLLHLMFSEEIGLSVNLKMLLGNHRKVDLCYTLLLHCSEMESIIGFLKRKVDPCYCLHPNWKWLPFSALGCLNKELIIGNIEIEENTSSSGELECDRCKHALPLYMLKCETNHTICRECDNAGKNALFVKTPCRWLLIML